MYNCKGGILSNNTRPKNVGHIVSIQVLLENISSQLCCFWKGKFYELSLLVLLSDYLLLLDMKNRLRRMRSNFHQLFT